MAIEHMVWLKFNDGVPAQRIAQHLDGLRALKDKIPGVIDLTCGKNITDRANGFTHGLYVRLTDKAALDAYGPHPAHQKVVVPLRQDAQIMAMDIER